jgi:hypothetical protein
MPLESWPPENTGPIVLERQGIRVELLPGWEGRIRLQFESDEGERAFPVLHVSTVPLSAQRADYGGGVVERLGERDVFVSLIEFGPEEAGSALYGAVDELPTLDPAAFARNQLQRRIRGQAGVQHFFTLNGRAFCLYVVLGSIARSDELVARANEMLRGLVVERP